MAVQRHKLPAEYFCGVGGIIWQTGRRGGEDKIDKNRERTLFVDQKLGKHLGGKKIQREFSKTKQTKTFSGDFNQKISNRVRRGWGRFRLGRSSPVDWRVPDSGKSHLTVTSLYWCVYREKDRKEKEKRRKRKQKKNVEKKRKERRCGFVCSAHPFSPLSSCVYIYLYCLFWPEERHLAAAFPSYSVLSTTRKRRRRRRKKQIRFVPIYGKYINDNNNNNTTKLLLLAFEL